MHYRYNFNTLNFEQIGSNSKQHYEPLLRHVHIPILVIDIYLVPVKNLDVYIIEVLKKATQQQIRFEKIIFDATLDPLEHYTEVTIILNNFSRENSIKCYLVLSQFLLNQHSHLIEITYPAWLFVFKRQKLPAIWERNKKYKFSCLNRNPTWHRLLFYTMIKEYGLIDQFVYSFYDRCPYQDHKVTATQYRSMRNFVSSDLYAKCLSNLQDFPISWNNEVLGNNDHSINHDAYANTWCNIVTETSTNIAFTSEKIWKPIASGQLFLIVGAPGTATWLKSLGIKTFDDSYDNESDVVLRLTQIVKIIQNHIDNPQAWWLQHKQEIKHNYYQFHSGNIEKMLLEPIIAQLNNK